MLSLACRPCSPASQILSVLARYTLERSQTAQIVQSIDKLNVLLFELIVFLRFVQGCIEWLVAHRWHIFTGLVLLATVRIKMRPKRT